MSVYSDTLSILRMYSIWESKDSVSWALRLTYWLCEGGCREMLRDVMMIDLFITLYWWQRILDVWNNAMFSNSLRNSRQVHGLTINLQKYVVSVVTCKPCVVLVDDVHCIMDTLFIHVYKYNVCVFTWFSCVWNRIFRVLKSTTHDRSFVFVYCCPDCPSYLANLNSISWTTLAICAAIKKCNLKIIDESLVNICLLVTSHEDVSALYNFSMTVCCDMGYKENTQHKPSHQFGNWAKQWHLLIC